MKLKVDTQEILMKEKDKMIQNLQASTSQGRAQSGGGNINRRVTCWSCGSTGHIRAECPLLNNTVAPGQGAPPSQ